MRNARRFAVAVGLLALLASCSNPNEPTPAASPGSSITCNATNGGTITNCGTGNGNVTNPTPSPSPSGLFPRPDYIKISMYGDQRCPTGVAPSTEDRTVRKGCTVALTISPKCKRADGPDVDCKIPEDAEPDEFGVSLGAEHVAVVPQGDNPRFNRNVSGISAGAATFSGSYQGQRVRDDFVLTVVN